LICVTSLEEPDPIEANRNASYVVGERGSETTDDSTAPQPLLILYKTIHRGSGAVTYNW
jgi:hypothetical protein